MGGWVKLALAGLVAALVAVLLISFTSGDDSTPPSTATVAEGQPKGPAEAKADAGKNAGGNPSGDKSDGGEAGNSAESAAPIEEEAGFTGAGSEEESGGDSGSGDANKGGSGGGKVGGLGNAASQGSKKSGKKKKKKKASKAPPTDPERDAASAVLVAYMSARAAADWPTACANLSPPATKPLEKVAGSGRGCVGTFTAVYPHLEPGAWANTMAGPITSLRVEGASSVAFYHGTTGRDYSIPMRKEGGVWKVAALGPVVVP
jgi:hypothetical protein